MFSKPNCSQATLYKSLGIDPKTILALAGVYGTVAFIANCVTTKYMADQWGRRKYDRPVLQLYRFANMICRMLIAGLSGVILIEIYAAVMQRQFQDTDNQVGKGFAILGIYLFVVCYCEFSFFRGSNEFVLSTPY